MNTPIMNKHNTLSNSSKHNTHHLAHSTGLFLSIACGIHCLALPFLFLFTSTTDTGFLAHPLFEAGIMGLAILFASYTIYNSYQQHQKTLPALLLAISLCVLLPAFVWHHHLWIVVGAVFLVLAQGINWRQQQAVCKH